MAKHAKLSASGSAKWMNCPGSVSLEDGLPNPSTEFAAEGAAAHEVATWCLINKKPAIDLLSGKIKVEGFEFEITHEMVDAVQTYVDFVNGLEGEHEWVEERVEYTDWVEGGFGTSDDIKIQILRPEGNAFDHHIINVTDFKYGKGVKVFAEWNSQAMIYGLGVLQSFSHLFEFRTNDIVNCVIVQSRLDHIDEFKISVSDLLRWAEKELKPKAEEALSDNPSFHPGEKQCRFCLAKATCRALAADSLKTASEDFSVIGEEFTLRDNRKLTNDEIGQLLGRIPAMLVWANSIKGYAFDELNVDHAVPGYKLVHGKKGNKKFTETDENKLLGALNNVGITGEEAVTRKIKTPTQLETLLKATKADKALREEFATLWEQPEGKPTIAKESDKREAIQSQIESDFEALTS